MCCDKCKKLTGLLVLALGISYLLVDFNIWNFWGISWVSAVLTLAGLTMLCSSSCSDCCEVPVQKAPAKKKKR